MKGFSPDLLHDIRRHLEEEKRQVAARIEALTAQDPFSDPSRLNDNAAADQEATEESSHDRFTALLEELKTQRDGIDAALVRISDGKYGFCTNCRQMVNTDRLAVLPTATLCLSCESTRKKK